MIKQSVIDEVRAQMDTQEVLQDLGVKFKRETACCPFHKEHTPSFHIWRRQNTYKCFGCGKSGDAITFLIEHEGKTFVESIEWLAAKYNVIVEYDQASAQESQEKKDEREEIRGVLKWAHKKYEDLLHSLPEESDAWQFLTQRGYSQGTCRRWSLGFSPTDWKFVTSPLINMGRLQPAISCGLVCPKEGNNFDMFRGRIIIPIQNATGQLIGFGGRDITGSKEAPKYLNPSESLVYNKQQTWFGLDKAIKAIKEEGYVYLVEGFFDLMSLHLTGMENTVASCGTEVTDVQCKILKRYTSHVVICFDNDQDKERSGKKNAGLEKMMKLINTFLKFDFKVEMIELPGGGDPDEYTRRWKPEKIVMLESIQT